MCWVAERMWVRLYLGPGPERRTAAALGGQPPPQTACSSSSAPAAQQRMNGATGRRRMQLDLRTAAPGAPQPPRVPQDRYAPRVSASPPLAASYRPTIYLKSQWCSKTPGNAAEYISHDARKNVPLTAEVNYMSVKVQISTT